MSDSPRFSIIVPHYDGAISDALLLRGLSTLAAQTLRNFEVLLLHDGPPSRPLPDLTALNLPALRYHTSSHRYNDWGHSLRDAGMRQSSADYIVHFNPDNLLYPNALQALDEASRQPVSPAPNPQLTDNPDILVFSIVMRGRNFNGRGFWRSRDPNHALICTGIPPQPWFIDCLQLVARRNLWLDAGGWYDKSKESDAAIYSALIARHGARYVYKVLGEHW